MGFVSSWQFIHLFESIELVHVLVLVFTVGICLTTPLNGSLDQSRVFRSINCQSPRFVQQVHRVLFGHPILGRLVIVISSGRVFQDPEVLFRASRCVCVFVSTSSVSMTSPVSLVSFSMFDILREGFRLGHNQDNVLSCRPSQERSSSGFSVVISYLSTPHSIVTRRTTRLRCRGLPRLGVTDHQCSFSGMLDPMTFNQPVVSQLGASSLQLELDMKSRRFVGAFPRILL